jgi:hypothetical protein
LVQPALNAFGWLDIGQQLGITNFIPVHELSERYWDRMDTHPSIRA